jgi:valyl-tRNA synthetase
MFQPCRDGKHDLIVITSNYADGYGAEEVVRWCRNCGAVVVDRDIDNRTRIGYFMNMKFPRIINRYNELVREKSE